MGHTENRIIRGVWLGSSAANAPSFASVVQVGEVKGDWCTQQLPSAAIHFSAPANRGADHKSNDCASARTGEGSSTSTTSALCTQREHPFPPSPSRGNALWRPLLGHSCLGALCSLVLFTGGPLGPESSWTAAPSSVCRD